MPDVLKQESVMNLFWLIKTIDDTLNLQFG